MGVALWLSFSGKLLFSSRYYAVLNDFFYSNLFFFSPAQMGKENWVVREWWVVAVVKERKDAV